MYEEKKSPLKSKTVWLNLITGVSTIVGTLVDVVPSNALPWVVGVQSALNIAMRFLTVAPIR